MMVSPRSSKSGTTSTRTADMPLIIIGFFCLLLAVAVAMWPSKREAALKAKLKLIEQEQAKILATLTKIQALVNGDHENKL